MKLKVGDFYLSRNKALHRVLGFSHPFALVARQSGCVYYYTNDGDFSADGQTEWDLVEQVETELVLAIRSFLS